MQRIVALSWSLLLVLNGVAQKRRQPIMLDDIHYYVSNRDSANRFFIQHFGARPMAQQPTNPLQFIDFLLIRPGQSTINISGRGPFPGMRVRDPKRWNRTVVEPSADLPPMYGMDWLAFCTKDLQAAIRQLKANGVIFISENFKLPAEVDVPAAMIWGPDYNRIVIVERKQDSGITPYGIDHIHYMVENLEANIQFFKDVYAGKLLWRKGEVAVMHVGKHKFVLSTPEGMGRQRSQVVRRHPDLFRYGVDHLGFMYKDIRPAFEYAKAKGYHFALEPTRMQYYDQPTVYTFAITATPDGMQMEMYQEDGRLGPRTEYLNAKQ
ncbi:MAG: VOC family protein [Cytophagales bacterium]|nr:VOC family protein [Bernardetiaceae bacterium]MDW8211382.1 VOC family protein [Cytophagales bacterium]